MFPIAVCSAVAKRQHSRLLGAEVEASGLLWAWNKGKHWFEGSRVTILIDHAPAARFLTSSTQQESGDLTAVRALMMPYIHLLRFVDSYTPGQGNTKAEALSCLLQRQPCAPMCSLCRQHKKHVRKYCTT